MKKLFLLPAFLIILFLSPGCGGMQTISLTLNCDGDCNNTNAIVISVYQLKSADIFKSTSFESLIRNPDEILKTDLIPDSKFEKMLAPGDSIEISKIEIKKETNFLGVIGDFHSPAKDGWKQVVSLASGLDNLKIIVHKNSLTCIAED
jgi:type VI secretion system VasD/TssJ family lipoprotein